ncbi:pantoate--beta-alanine ligase [Elioraea thermophila]|uniref:pantoate--beta-alanine ligase n=1 Tax=Elioraea thermophila TaxID=2185104 RepID=UPI000DF3AA96|nr:pantoate--beta-alanine ligase [Elioraea thermophila]
MEVSTLVLARTRAELRDRVAAWRRQGQLIGFVPTMGALHQGHAALVRRARAECDRVVVSIFVNPTQFGPNEDFDRYPRTEDADRALLESLGVDLLFAPPVREIYPPGDSTRVVVGSVAEPMEGERRPGFFTGVATVCTRLFALVSPDRAYFGEKDWQQLLVVRRLVEDLGLPLTIEAVATVREADGLALSSRNAYLSPAERAVAPLLHRCLVEAAEALRAGEPFPPVRERAVQRLVRSGFAAPDYLDLRDEGTLVPLAAARPGARLFIAARLGATRLIDNLAVPLG